MRALSIWETGVRETGVKGSRCQGKPVSVLIPRGNRCREDQFRMPINRNETNFSLMIIVVSENHESVDVPITLELVAEPIWGRSLNH
jgi:hypothetical protein